MDRNPYAPLRIVTALAPGNFRALRLRHALIHARLRGTPLRLRAYRRGDNHPVVPLLMCILRRVRPHPGQVRRHCACRGRLHRQSETETRTLRVVAVADARARRGGGVLMRQRRRAKAQDEMELVARLGHVTVAVAAACRAGTEWRSGGGALDVEDARSLRRRMRHATRSGGPRTGGIRIRPCRFGQRGARGVALAPAEDGLERGDAGAGDGDGELDHGPEVDGDGVAEGVGGLGVDADGVEADYGSDTGEGAGAKDEEEGELLARRAVDGAERLEGEGENPEVGDDVEGRGCWG